MKQDPNKPPPGRTTAETPTPPRQATERVSAIVYQAACDEPRTIRSISPQVESLLGFTPADFQSDPLLWSKQLHPDDRERVLAELARTRTVGEPFVSEYRMLRRDGRVVWFRDQGTVERDGTGTPTSLRGVMCDITEHKAAEAGLQENVGWLRVLFELAPDGYFLADDDGVLLDENRAAEELMGIPREEVIGKKPAEMGILSPEEVLRAAALVDSTTVGGQGVTGEFTVRRKDGTSGTLELRMFPVPLRGARAVLAITRDMTESRRVQEVLRQSEQRLRTVFESGPVAMALTGPTGQMLMFNSALCRMLGLTEEELAGRSFFDLSHPDDLPPSQLGLKRLLSGEEPFFHTEKRYIHKDGHVIWADVRAAAVRDAQGSVLHFITHVQDVTETRRVQEALRESEQRFRAAFENGAVPMALTAPDGRMMMVNSALCRMIGYSPSELVGRGAFDFTHPEDLALTRSNMQRLVLGGESSYRIEKRYLHKDGHVIWADVSAAAVRDAQGRFLYFVAHLQDITERKQVEEALAERTRSLAALNDLAIELALLHSEDIPGVLVKYLRRTTGATVSSLAKYDPRRRVLVPSQVETDPAMLDQVQTLLGKSLLEVHSPVSEEMYRRMLSTIVGTVRTLTETTFGAVPPEVGTAIQKALDIDRFIGIAYVVGGELYGTSVLAMGRRTPDPPGDLLASFAHMAAISLRRCAVEQALQESEEKFRALAEQSPNMIFINKKGRVVYANRRCEEVMGYTREELCAPDFDFLSLSPPEWRDFMRSRFEQHMKGREMEPVEYSLVTKDGRRIEAIVTTRLTSYEGETALFGTVTDLTELRRLQRQVLESAEGERRRISRDMHDVLGQNLTGAAMLSEALQKSLAAATPSEAPKAAQITRLLYEATGDVRQFAKGLCPVDATPDGLMKALSDLAAGASRLFGISCRFRSAEPVLVHDASVAENLYHIAQEAITNSVKHGGAKNVTMALHSANGFLTLSIEDDGRGFPEDVVESTGMGLRIMRDRTSMMHGILDTRNRNEGGAVVSCRVPESPGGPPRE